MIHFIGLRTNELIPENSVTPLKVRYFITILAEDHRVNGQFI